jgi:hypothetical protein
MVTPFKQQLCSLIQEKEQRRQLRQPLFCKIK